MSILACAAEVPPMSGTVLLEFEYKVATFTGAEVD